MRNCYCFTGVTHTGRGEKEERVRRVPKQEQFPFWELQLPHAPIKFLGSFKTRKANAGYTVAAIRCRVQSSRRRGEVRPHGHVLLLRLRSGRHPVISRDRLRHGFHNRYPAHLSNKNLSPDETANAKPGAGSNSSPATFSPRQAPAAQQGTFADLSLTVITVARAKHDGAQPHPP